MILSLSNECLKNGHLGGVKEQFVNFKKILVQNICRKAPQPTVLFVKIRAASPVDGLTGIFSPDSLSKAPTSGSVFHCQFDPLPGARVVSATALIDHDRCGTGRYHSCTENGTDKATNRQTIIGVHWYQFRSCTAYRGMGYEKKKKSGGSKSKRDSDEAVIARTKVEKEQCGSSIWNVMMINE